MVGTADGAVNPGKTICMLGRVTPPLQTIAMKKYFTYAN
jgi:hypothetical protein